MTDYTDLDSERTKYNSGYSGAKKCMDPDPEDKKYIVSDPEDKDFLFFFLEDENYTDPALPLAVLNSPSVLP